MIQLYIPVMNRTNQKDHSEVWIDIKFGMEKYHNVDNSSLKSLPKLLRV